MAARRSLMLAIVLVGALAVASTSAGAQVAMRVVSINLCADQLVSLLANRESILSVTHLSADPSISYVASRVTDIPVNYGRSEEVLALRPDLVVAGRFAARPAVAMLQRFGVEVVDLPIPESFADIRAQVRFLSRRLGVAPRGEEMVEEMDRQLGAISIGDRPGPRALVLGVRGFTSGTGTLVDEVLAAAGLRNVAVELGIDGYGQIGLEEILRADPEIVVINQPTAAFPSLARDVLAHPALRHFGGRIIQIDPSLWTCGGPYTVEAVTFLARATQ